VALAIEEENYESWQ